jgi:hypothetical protein
MNSSQAAEIERDVLLMTGGHFTPAALTPEGFEVIRSRARSQPEAYLDAFERLFLGDNFDVEWHSDILASVFLEQLRDVAPDRVRSLAAELVRRYGEALAGAEKESARTLGIEEPPPPGPAMRRLEEYRAALESLAEEP